MSKRKNSHRNRKTPPPAADPPAKLELELGPDPRQYDWLKQLEPREGIDFQTVPPARLRGGGR